MNVQRESSPPSGVRRTATTHRSTRWTTRRSQTVAGLPLELAPPGSRWDPRRLGLPLIALTLGLLSLLFVLWPSKQSPTVGEPVAFLEVKHGSVGLLPVANSNDSRLLLPLESGAPLHAGALVQTDENGDRASLRLTDGTSVRLDQGTRLRLISDSTMDLEGGAVYVDSPETGGGVEVRTTFGVVRDIGTQFEVRLDAGNEVALRIWVREGKILLKRDGESSEAEAGESLELLADGTLERGTVPSHGPQWEWVLGIAPVPDLEGLDLASFLRWFRREGGWGLAFEDPSLAVTSTEILLHGNGEGLTPTQAAAMVLQGSGLAYRLEEGRIVVVGDDDA